MPNIPTIPIPSAEPERIPTPYDNTPVRPPSAEGRRAQAMAGAIAQGAEVVTSAVLKAKEEADRIAVTEAEATLGRGIVDSIHGEQGFRRLQGHAALEASGAAHEAVDQSYQKLLDALPNDRQRFLFRERAQTDVLGAHRAIEQHVGTEIDRVATEAFKAKVQVAVDNAVAVAPTDPFERQRQIDSLEPVANDEARRRGLRGVEAEVFTRNLKGAAAEEVLQQIVATEGRSADAKAFLDYNRKDIGKHADKYDKALRTYSIADQALAEVKRIETDNADPEAQVKALLELPGEVGAKAADIYRERRTIREHATAEAEGKRLGRVLDAIEAGSVRTSDTLERLPDFQNLQSPDMAKARGHLRMILNQGRALGNEDRRAQREADLAALRDFEARPIDERANLDVRQEYAGSASKPGVDLILKSQQKAKAEWGKDNGVGEAEFDRLVKAEVQGVVKGKPALEKLLGTLHRQRSDWIDANPGKVLPRDQAMKWIAEAVTVRHRPILPDKFSFELAEPGALRPVPPADQPYVRLRQGTAAPAQPGTVRLRGPGGQLRSAPRTPELDAWLKTHPDWSAE